MIGVDKAYRNNITPYDLYPEFRPEKTLREVIYDFPRLEWGEIYVDDFLHNPTVSHYTLAVLLPAKAGKAATFHHSPRYVQSESVPHRW